MAYDKIVKQYLQALQNEYRSAIRGKQHTAELSYRPVLDILFRGLAGELNKTGNIDIVLEPRNQGKVGRPDWRVHDSVSLGIYGYIEAKGFSELPFDTVPYQEQFKRYMSLKHKLVLTDGIDFVFCMGNDLNPVTIELVEKSRLATSDWSKLSPNPRFELLMRQFLLTRRRNSVMKEHL